MPMLGRFRIHRSHENIGIQDNITWFVCCSLTHNQWFDVEALLACVAVCVVVRCVGTATEVFCGVHWIH